MNNYPNERTPLNQGRQVAFSVRWSRTKQYFSDFCRRTRRTPSNERTSNSLESQNASVYPQQLRSKMTPMTFLFVGQKNVGKSTAIKRVHTKLLRSNNTMVTMEDRKEHGNSFVTWKYTNDDTAINVVEVPAFGSSANFEHNAKVITALNEYLKQDQRAVPKLVFITASLTDSRFQGPVSNFSNMLNCLKYQGNRLTTDTCNNLVLLLTHADSLDIRDTLEFRKDAYVNQCEEILGIKPQPLTMTSNGNNDELVDLFYSSMGCFSQSKTLAFKEPLETSMDSLVISVPKPLITKMTSNNFVGTDIFPEKENMTFISDRYSFDTEKQNYKPYFIRRNLTKTFDDSQVYNVVNNKSKIVLADGTEIEAQHCSTGDRVLGHKGVGVITDCIKLTSDVNQIDKIDVAEIYVVLKQGGKSLYQFYEKGNQKFRLSDMNPGYPSVSSENSLVYLEIDGGYGTFVVDNYVRKCTEQ